MIDREILAESLHAIRQHPLGGACSECRLAADYIVREYHRRMEIVAEYDTPANAQPT